MYLHEAASAHAMIRFRRASCSSADGQVGDPGDEQGTDCLVVPTVYFLGGSVR